VLKTQICVTRPQCVKNTSDICLTDERRNKFNSKFASKLTLQLDNVNLLKPTGYVVHHQFNIRQLYALLTLYLCVLYLSENKQRLVPLTA